MFKSGSQNTGRGKTMLSKIEKLERLARLGATIGERTAAQRAADRINLEHPDVRLPMYLRPSKIGDRVIDGLAYAITLLTIATVIAGGLL